MSKTRRPPSSDASPAQEGYEPEHPLLHQLGYGVGLGAGVLVTDLLALVPSWREPLLDEHGQPVQQIPGAERIGDHDLEKRHQEVVGPQIDAYGDTLQDGWWRDLVEGVGAGATRAPGATYEADAKIQDGLSEIWKRITGQD
jgi:hypothetical protein